MPIPLGVLAVAGAGAGPEPVGTNVYEWLETTVLTGSQSSISFSNLNTNYASTYQHLQIRLTARTDRTGADSDPIRLRFNSDSGSNYARHGLLGYFSTVASNSAANADAIYITENTAVNQNASNIFGATIADILDPFETTKYTTVRSLAGMYASGWQSVELRSGLWMNTNAITTITLTPLIGSNFVTGSRFSLYGLRSA